MSTHTYLFIYLYIQIYETFIKTILSSIPSSTRGAFLLNLVLHKQVIAHVAQGMG